MIKRRLTIGSMVVCLLMQFTLIHFAVAEKVTLTYLTRYRSEEFGRPVWNEAAKRYEQQNPNIKIKYIDTTYQRLREEMLLKAQAGNPPDISEPVVSWVPEMGKAGILEPIRNFFTEEELSEYVQSPIKDATYKGVAYGIPIKHGPILLYANKELLKKAGYKVRGPEDIFEFKEMIEKTGSLGKDEQGRKILGFSLRNVQTRNSALWFTPWIWAWGGELVDEYNRPTLDSMGFRKALEFYQWMTNNGYAAKGQDPYATRVVFAQGRAGFVYDGPWLRSMLRTITKSKKVDDMYIVCPQPKGWNGTNWTISNPDVMVVFKGSSHKKEAFKFVKWWSTNEWLLGELWDRASLIPCYRPFIKDDPRFRTKFAKPFIKQLPYSRGAPWRDPRWPGLTTILAEALTAAVTGEDVNQIAKRVQSSFEELVAE